MNIRAALGVAGVSPYESREAKYIGHLFEYLVLVALLAVFLQIILSYTDFNYDFTWLNYVVWTVFAFEFSVNLAMVKNRVRYFQQNWLNFAIVILAFPWIEWSSEWAIIIRSLRLLLLMRFFVAFFQDAVFILKKNRFGQILVGFSFLIVGAGGVFVYIEDRPFIDGIWYAIVTVTTVGYGDVVPQTENGRIFGAILIIFGVLFFSLVTANFSAFLIGSEQRKLEKEILGYVQNTEKRLTKLSTENERHVEYIMLHMSKEIEQLKDELNDLRQKEFQRIQQEFQKDSELRENVSNHAHAHYVRPENDHELEHQDDTFENATGASGSRANPLKTSVVDSLTAKPSASEVVVEQQDNEDSLLSFKTFKFFHKRPKKD